MSPGDAAGEGPGGVLAAAERRAGRLGGGAYAFLLCLVALAAVGIVIDVGDRRHEACSGR